MKTKMFLNLPVKDLNRSIAFFTELGFSFNPKFTSEKATCLIIGENINVMLLVEEFYKTFMDKEICNTAISNEAIISISVATREQVDEMIGKVVKAGESEYKETKDYGWMYQRNFRDIDGHHWEIFFMDEIQIPEMA